MKSATGAVSKTTLVLGLGAESVEEYVFISIYCCWERRGGLCRESEVLCLFFPPALPEPGCPCWGRAVGTVRVTRDRDTSEHGRESDPVLTQGPAPRPGVC